MAHLSKATHKFLSPLSSDKEYRITAWLNIKTQFNESINKYEQMSDAQKQACEAVYQHMVREGIELSITLSERTAAQDVREFPKAAFIKLFVNKPYDQNRPASFQPTPDPGHQAPPQEQQAPRDYSKEIEDSGW